MSERRESYTNADTVQYVGTDASVHQLLNEATEWMQYATGVTELLSDLVHEADVVNCRRMALALEAVGAITRMGAQRAAQAHAMLHWEQAKAAAQA
jgi:hypothetical protein